MRFDGGRDQAEGLRRLLLRNHTRVITVAAGKRGVGRTSVTINLAAALAQSGKDVLVLDENAAPGNVAERLGLPLRHDLLDAARGKCAPGQALLAARGFGVLPVARAMQQLARLDDAGQQHVGDLLGRVSEGMDMLLVDAALPFAGCADGVEAASSGLASEAMLLVVTDATASGITASYTLIKRLALENARLQFGIVVNKAADERAARTAFDNMAGVARSNLAARLEYLGHIPQDGRMDRAARLGKSVVEAFPGSPPAQACLELAQRLLGLAACQDDGETGVRAVFRSLLRQVSGLRDAAAASNRVARRHDTGMVTL